MRTLLELLAYYGLQGEEYERNGTFLQQQEIGTKVFSEKITFCDNPDTSRYAPRVPVDWLGVRRTPKTFIEKGVLKARWYEHMSALKYKKEAGGYAGPLLYGPSHLCLSAGSGPSEEEAAIRKLENGLFIPSLHYTNIVDITDGTWMGHTRYGVYVVEKGEVVARSTDLQFLDSISRMLNNVAWLSRKLEPAFTTESYGIEALPVTYIPRYTQINDLKILASNKLHEHPHIVQRRLTHL
jgi:predicted Zn-dependent protease